MIDSREVDALGRTILGFSEYATVFARDGQRSGHRWRTTRRWKVLGRRENARQLSERRVCVLGCSYREFAPQRGTAATRICREQICPERIRACTPAAARRLKDMTEDAKVPQFTAEVRRELYMRRVLVLDGVLDDDNGMLLTTQMLTLAAEDPQSDIALWIHSPGGSVPSMVAIRDVMRLVPCDVSTLAIGLACSAGQFLLSAGAPGKRRALPHARVFC